MKYELTTCLITLVFVNASSSETNFTPQKNQIGVYTLGAIFIALIAILFVILRWIDTNYEFARQYI